MTTTTTTRTITRITAFSLLSLLSLACTDDKRTDSTPRDTTYVPAALTTAHEAYLTGDYIAMGERLKEVIADPQAAELARDNAFALLESAYEATHGELPARASLPKEIKTISLGVLNGVTPWGAHRSVYLGIPMAKGRAAHIKDIRLTRLPSEPILALAEKRGTLTVEPMDGGLENVKLEVRRLDVLPERGAFSVQVVFDDAMPGVDAFVLASKLVASTSLEVSSPAVGQVFNDARPEIAWRPYRSPELAPWETRAVSVWIGRDATQEAAWDFYKWQPGELGRVHVGDVGDIRSTLPTKLEPGSYGLSLMCMEERTFGAIRITRGAQVGRPFSVVAR